MALMQWDETMSVGVELLDRQHQRLIALINETYEAIQKHDEKAIGELVVKMREYANMHFAAEEGYMKQYGFPGLEDHKFKHARFNQEVDTFQKEQFAKTNLSQIFVFLSRWLTSHIMDEDKQYMQYVSKSESIETDGSDA